MKKLEYSLNLVPVIAIFIGGVLGNWISILLRLTNAEMGFSGWLRNLFAKLNLSNEQLKLERANFISSLEIC